MVPLQKISIPVYRPSLNGSELRAVTKCLRSSWISSKGPFVEKFESAMAGRTQHKHAVAVSNGTTALHAALLALGIGPGDEVVVPTLTYIAPVNAIAYTGARPIFVDSDRLTWQMNPKEVTRALGRRTRAILAVHLYGHPCDLAALEKISRDFGVPLVEDCAEALGSTYRGRPVGKNSRCATYSFFGNKTITTGEGGMVTTNSLRLANVLRSIRGQGLAKNREYWHDRIGYNYRMTNVCAAIGFAQLRKLTKFLTLKRSLERFYKQALRGLPLSFQSVHPCGQSSCWMVSVLVKDKRQRDGLRRWLGEDGIETRPLFQPAHLMPMYRSTGHAQKFPVAEDLARRGLNLPSHPTISLKEKSRIVNRVRSFFAKTSASGEK